MVWSLRGMRPGPHQVAPAPSGGEAKDASNDPDDDAVRPAAGTDQGPHQIVIDEGQQSQHHTSDNEAPPAQPASLQVATRPHGNTNTTAVTLPEARATESPAIEMQFPMWLMPIHIFLGLTALLPHQELRRMNMLVQREASMETVIFVSHQWTSFDNPDHTGRQLRTLQRLFERMLTGQVPEVDAPLVDKATFKSKVKVAPREWSGILRDAFIWVDFAGVPQKEATSTNDAASGSDGRCVILSVQSNDLGLSIVIPYPPSSVQSKSSDPSIAMTISTPSVLRCQVHCSAR